MAAQRCSLCGISYPTMTTFATCPIHDEPTDYLSNVDPSPDWKQQMERRLKQQARDNEQAKSVPLARGVAVSIGGGRFWVDQGELSRAGVRLSRMVPNQFHLFELDDGWIYETQGWDDPRRRWWVERVIRAEEASAP